MFKVFIESKSLAGLKKAIEELNDEVNASTVKCEQTVEELVSTTPILEVAAKPEGDPAVEVSTAEAAQLVVDTPELAAQLTKPALNVNLPELDKDGLPWDKRIHSSSKKFVKDGTWRYKRGVDEAVVAQVKQELLNSIQMIKNPPVTPALPTSPAALIEIPATLTPVTSQAQPEALSTAPSAVVATTPAALPTMGPSGHTFETFSAQFAMIVGTLITEKKITQEYVNQLKQYFSVDEIWNVSEDQKKEMFNSFVEFGFIQKM